jgi:xanthine dehydrogenase accessory factor
VDEPYAIATVVWRQGPSSSKLGSRAIITANGHLDGWIGGACAEPVVIREAREVLATGQPRLLLLGTAEHAAPEGVTFVPISCQSEGAMQIYIEPVVPAPHLVIVGDSPMTRTLAALATTLGWRLGGDPDDRSMVVVATQGHGDEEALEGALAAHPAYVGLVASGRRGQAVLGYLADRGVPGEQLDAVRVPAGLDLGSTTHEEIAVAILAELIQLRASGAIPGTPATLSMPAPSASAPQATPATPGPFAPNATTPHGVNAPSRPIEGAYGSSTPVPAPADGAYGSSTPSETATDPVCGMTVRATGEPVMRDGVAYYFCCAGCRRAFTESESRC